MRENKGQMFLVFFVLCSFIACQHSQPHTHRSVEEHPDEILGMHGGTLLTRGTFSLEIVIFEKASPPRFRVFIYENGKPLPPSDVTVDITLIRLGGRQDHFTLYPANDYLTSDRIVEEPHSFDVIVKANKGSQEYEWRFQKYEGRTKIPDLLAKESGIETEIASPQTISIRYHAPCFISHVENLFARVKPRFPGVLQKLNKKPGDRVKKDEVVAIVESNESLRLFEVRSPISGAVVKINATEGEFVSDSELYNVLDTSEVYVDIFAPAKNSNMFQHGQKIRVIASDRQTFRYSVISYISPEVDNQTQTRLIRAALNNQDESLLPGMFAECEITTNEKAVPVAVKKSALQNYNGRTVVFVKYGDVYEARPIQTGESDGEFVEVIAGISDGEEYVAKNSFLIKADILKTDASHDH